MPAGDERPGVAALVRGVVPSCAITALTYLREASALTAATPRLVRDARASLTRVQSPGRSV